MPSQEDINAQQQLLSTNRQNLQLYLRQRDTMSRAHVTPVVANGILEAQQNIRRIKVVLRQWDVSVEDLPDDDDNDESPFPRYRQKQVAGSFAIVFVVIALLWLAYEVGRRNNPPAVIAGNPSANPLSVTSGVTQPATAQISTAVPTAIPTATQVPPTNTLVPPTNTQVPPTNTLVPPTNTPEPPTNTPAPPRPNPDILFSDTFDNGLNPAWTSELGEFRVLHGQLVVAKQVGNHAKIVTGSPDWHNYTIDFDAGNFRHDWGSGSDPGITIYARIQDTGNALKFLMRNTSRSCGVLKDGKYTGIDESLNSGYMRDVNKVGEGAHHIQLKVQNDRYLLLIDGKQLCDFNDSTFSNGSVAFETLSYTDNSQGDDVWIDNVKITRLP
jgi:hypothetical protein